VIVLDTNVVSELARRTPDPNVVAWLEDAGSDLSITATTVGELCYGLERLPQGRRRSGLARDIAKLISTFQDRVLSYDHRAGRRFGKIAALRESLGRPITVADAQIAAICFVHDAACATRNTKDLIDTGVDLVNPWLEKRAPS
jgi:predicted nucleic acid-binding protein